MWQKYIFKDPDLFSRTFGFLAAAGRTSVWFSTEGQKWFGLTLTEESWHRWMGSYCYLRSREGSSWGCTRVSSWSGFGRCPGGRTGSFHQERRWRRLRERRRGRRYPAPALPTLVSTQPETHTNSETGLRVQIIDREMTRKYIKIIHTHTNHIPIYQYTNIPIYFYVNGATLLLWALQIWLYTFCNLMWITNHYTCFTFLKSYCHTRD